MPAQGSQDDPLWVIEEFCESLPHVQDSAYVTFLPHLLLIQIFCSLYSWSVAFVCLFVVYWGFFVLIVNYLRKSPCP